MGRRRGVAQKKPLTISKRKSGPEPISDTVKEDVVVIEDEPVGEKKPVKESQPSVSTSSKVVQQTNASVQGKFYPFIRWVGCFAAFLLSWAMRINTLTGSHWWPGKCQFAT